MDDSTKDLIQRLYYALDNMRDYARELPDEMVEGDPDWRKVYIQDMKEARELCQEAAAAIKGE